MKARTVVKLLGNPVVRRTVVRLLKSPIVRRILIKQAMRQLRRR